MSSSCFKTLKPSRLKTDGAMGIKNLPHLFKPLTITKFNIMQILKKFKKCGQKNNTTHFKRKNVTYHKVFDVRVFSPGQLLCLYSTAATLLLLRIKARLTSRQYVNKASHNLSHNRIL